MYVKNSTLVHSYSTYTYINTQCACEQLLSFVPVVAVREGLVLHTQLPSPTGLEA